MIFRYLVFFTLIKILCYVFTIGTPVSDQDGNHSQFDISDTSSYFRFGKSKPTKEEDKSFTHSLQRTLHTAQHFASDLYYGENQQIRGDMLCCLCFMCCCNETQDTGLDESRNNISGKELDKTDAAVENSIKYIDIESSSGEWIGIDGESGSEADGINDSLSHLVRQSTIVSIVNSLKEWIESRPESYFPPTLEDHMIERFFYVCQKKIKRTKEVIKLFFKYRSEMRNFFTNRDPLEENLQEIQEIVHILPLLQRTEDGKQVYIIHIADQDVEKFNFLDFAKMYYNITDVRMKIDKEIPTGDIPIFDISGVSTHHLTKIKSSEDVADFLKITQEANPVFLQKIHLINVPFWLRMGFHVVSMFVNENVRSRITLHAGTETLFEHIQREIIPTEYGGKSGTSVTEIRKYWKQRVEDNREWLMTNPWRVDVPPEES